MENRTFSEEVFRQCVDGLRDDIKHLIESDVEMFHHGLELMKRGNYMEACTGIYPLVEEEFDKQKKG